MSQMIVFLFIALALAYDTCILSSTWSPSNARGITDFLSTDDGPTTSNRFLPYELPARGPNGAISAGFSAMAVSGDDEMLYFVVTGQWWFMELHRMSLVNGTLFPPVTANIGVGDGYPDRFVPLKLVVSGHIAKLLIAPPNGANSPKRGFQVVHFDFSVEDVPKYHVTITDFKSKSPEDMTTAHAGNSFVVADSVGSNGPVSFSSIDMDTGNVTLLANNLPCGGSIVSFHVFDNGTGAIGFSSFYHRTNDNTLHTFIANFKDNSCVSVRQLGAPFEPTHIQGVVYGSNNSVLILHDGQLTTWGPDFLSGNATQTLPIGGSLKPQSLMPISPCLSISPPSKSTTATEKTSSKSTTATEKTSSHSGTSTSATATQTTHTGTPSPHSPVADPSLFSDKNTWIGLALGFVCASFLVVAIVWIMKRPKGGDYEKLI